MNEALIHLRSLARLRWGAIGAQAAVLAVLAVLAPDHVALPSACGVVLANAASNVVLSVVARRAKHVPPPTLLAVLGADVLLLTLLLALTGGPFNPFTFLYLVEVALATIVTPGLGAWCIAGAAAAAYGALFFSTDLSHHDHAHMVLHLKGMWVAFVVAAALVCLFVGRVQVGAARARSLAERNARLASLATLASGAAHELATPLGTIAVAAGELARKASTGALADDARLVLEQVDRCRRILQQLAADGGQLAGEAPTRTQLSAVVGAVVDDLRGGPVSVVVAMEADATVVVPRGPVVGALRGLVQNALHASPQSVRITVKSGASVEIDDDGVGMAADVLARIGEPFFTTRPEGKGMGLGVFVARSLAEQLGGRLDIESELARGTHVTWTFAESSS